MINKSEALKCEQRTRAYKYEQKYIYKIEDQNLESIINI